LADIVTAIVELLKADAGIAALAGEHVYGGELPPDVPALMPRSAIVVQPSGGVPFAPASTADLEAQRIDLVCYGPTLREAFALRSRGNRVLLDTKRRVIASTLIHWVQWAGGYLTGRDRDAGWPYAFQSYQALFASDEVV
jgi:hypothetical protein